VFEHIPLKTYLYISAYGTWIYSIYVCYVLYLAWRKKVLELWYRAPTFHYDAESIHVSDSFSLVGTLVVYLVSGLALVFVLIFVTIVVLTAPDFWLVVIIGFAPLWIGWAIYFAIFVFVIEPFLRTHITDGKYVRRGKETPFKFLSLMFELFYIPLAPLYVLQDIATQLGFMLVAFIRPDVICFPRGLEAHSIGHNVFMASVKLYINRIKQMYLGYPWSADLNFLNRALSEKKADLHRYKKEEEWLRCDQASRDIKKIRTAIALVETRNRIQTDQPIRYRENEKIISLDIVEVGCKTIKAKNPQACFLWRYYTIHILDPGLIDLVQGSETMSASSTGLKNGY